MCVFLYMTMKAPASVKTLNTQTLANSPNSCIFHYWILQLHSVICAMLFLSFQRLSVSTLNDALLAAFQLCSGKRTTPSWQVRHLPSASESLPCTGCLIRKMGMAFFNLLRLIEKTPEWIWFSMHTLCHGSRTFQQQLCACCRSNVENVPF